MEEPLLPRDGAFSPPLPGGGYAASLSLLFLSCPPPFFLFCPLPL